MPRTAAGVILIVLGLLLAVGVLPMTALIVGILVAVTGAALLV
jgi:hypothetical protein